jgi:hypothetical protein
VPRTLIPVAAGLVLTLCLSGARADGKPVKKDDGGSCGNHGTTVQFLDNPSEAARQALKEHKLVLVLHVSGLFEDPKLT